MMNTHSTPHQKSTKRGQNTFPQQNYHFQEQEESSTLSAVSIKGTSWDLTRTSLLEIPELFYYHQQ